MKKMDAGYYEAEPFYKAGADICTVLGTADIGTIKGVIDVANKYGKMAQVDLINVTDKKARTLEVAKLGAHIIGVHTGLDQQAAGQTPFSDLAMVTGLNTGAKVSVAGGVKAATAAQVVDAGADIVVAGAAIYGAADPAASAAEITGIVHAGNATTSSMKWLPWAIIAGAVILGLFLLNRGSTDEVASDAATTMEETVQSTGDAMDEAGAAVGDALDASGEAMSDAAEATGEAVDAAAAEASDLVEEAKEAASAE